MNKHTSKKHFKTMGFIGWIDSNPRLLREMPRGNNRWRLYNKMIRKERLLLRYTAMQPFTIGILNEETDEIEWIETMNLRTEDDK